MVNEETNSILYLIRSQKTLFNINDSLYNMKLIILNFSKILFVEKKKSKRVYHHDVTISQNFQQENTRRENMD